MNKLSRLFRRLIPSGPDHSGVAAGPGAKRILFVANGFIPTLQLSFFVPLQPLIESGEVVCSVLTELDIQEAFGKEFRSPRAAEWARKKLKAFSPTEVVFCRYSGPHCRVILDFAKKNSIPTVFHVDDDLLNVPIEIGPRKFALHNEPVRLETVRCLLEECGLVYCSTESLKARFRSYGIQTPIVAGAIYCSGEIRAPATRRPATTVGYMGFDHAHDLEMVLPALSKFMSCSEGMRFELFGSIPLPKALERFGDRVSVLPPVQNYQEFMSKFATLQWDIGICPLMDTPFNAVKADTKWVEYTSVGTAVVASAGTIYDRCCADGCGVLAANNDEWFRALRRLAGDEKGRHAQVVSAQRRLVTEYSAADLKKQVLGVLDHAAKATRTN